MVIQIEDQLNFMFRWANMIDRCDNKENKAYHNYGGRGISVCSRWYDFFSYISDLPDDFFVGAQLDRIDNSSDYRPGNVRWVTVSSNSKNRRTNRNITFGGRTMCASDWAKNIGISIPTLMERLDTWELSDALMLPKGTRLHNRWDGHTKKINHSSKRVLKLFEYNDKKYTMKELSAISDIPTKLLRKRINERGWDVKKAVDTKVCYNR